MEIYKDIEGYEGLYQISNTGKVKSINCILKPRLGERGYLYVNLYNNTKRKTWKIHRLVALHFVKNPDDKPEVNHKDTIKTNNNSNNLEWVTRSENEQHAHKHNLKNLPKGKEHWNYKHGEYSKYI